MRISSTLVIALGLAGGCKDKKTPADQPPPTGSAGTAAGSAPTEPASAAKLVAGEATFGCIAWSEKTKSVACVVGETGSTGTEVALAMIGGTEGRVPLVPQTDEPGAKPTIDEAAATAANAALAKDGFAPLAGAAQKLEAGKPTDVGGAKLAWTSKETPSNADNTAPAYDNKLVATCAGKDLEVFHVSGEGQGAEPSARVVGDRVIVEVKLSRGLEGEYASGFAAAVLDPTACTLSGKI